MPTHFPAGTICDLISCRWIPEVQKAFKKLGSEKREVVIVGIEAHICVTQTTLDLLREGHKVYVLADGVSVSLSQDQACRTAVDIVSI